MDVDTTGKSSARLKLKTKV